MKKLKSLISIDQVDEDFLKRLFKSAADFQLPSFPFSGYLRLPPFFHGQKTVANLFYEPSTRTAASFYVAATRLGASVYSVDDVQFSSMAKGESLEDTIRVIGGYVDAIVLRHPEDDAAERAAAVSPVPVINAGCGAGEHPTQALLDLYTIEREMGPLSSLAGLKVGLMGDLKHGRTVHSLVKLLRHFDVRIYLISPSEMKLPIELSRPDDLVTYHLDDFIETLDVLYVARVQWERMLPSHRALAHTNYEVTPELMSKAKSGMILMHPLPRREELPRQLDDDPRAIYFQQAKNGLYIRMALLSMLMGGG